MIGRLTGRIEFTGEDHLLIDVNGVGYVVYASSRSLKRARAMGEAASLLIETQVREDAITLIGFADAEERDAFKMLATVQGVGTRVALSLLSSLSPAQLAGAIAGGDTRLLCSADGIGQKLAARLVTELKDKVASLGAATVTSFPTKGIASKDGVAGDAVSTLTHLGFRRDEAFAAVMHVLDAGKGVGFDELIRLCLQELASPQARAVR